MDRVDPDTLLDWLSSGHGCDLENRLMQRDALERLCEVLLFSDNVDRCFEMWSPRVFLPALCRIFLDDSVPEEILEIAARAVTYFLDVSHDCSRRIVQVDGAVKAVCSRLTVADMSDFCSKELAQQCIKILEGVCQREHAAVYEAGGLRCLLAFVQSHGAQCHLDVTHSAMNASVRLCTRAEPSDETLTGSVDCLRHLLEHEDSGVVDATLRCFATLVDRFAKRHTDPAPLAPDGVMSVLLSQLRLRSERSFSAVTAVLTSLCKASPEVAQALLIREDLALPDALIEALRASAAGSSASVELEKLTVDSLRLSELVLLLVFEGRVALPQLTGSSVVSAALGLRSAGGSGAAGASGATGASGERPHRQLIDAIRSKDTESVVDAIESGAFDVNYMDDVGQTLLNWAAAFGTKEMVKFLCSRGADVNFGRRSSSLHYAACFGRPEIVKLLLKYGADPALKDEENKLPIDKARERHDAGHREVISILNSARDYMPPAPGSAEAAAAAAAVADAVAPTSKATPSAPAALIGAAGFPECRPAFLQKFAPAFLALYWDSMSPGIRKCAMHLLLKLLGYAEPEFLLGLAGSDLAGGLVQLVAHALQEEQADTTAQRTAALKIAEQLLEKAKPAFGEQFFRLGAIAQIRSMHEVHTRERARQKRAQKEIAELKAAAGKATQPPPPSATQSATPGSGTAATSPVCIQELEQHRQYQWSDWTLARTRESLFLFSRHCAVELPNMSNGWFKYQLDSRVCTMYSSGSAESDDAEQQQQQQQQHRSQRQDVQDDFTRRLQAVRALASRHRGPLRMAELRCEVGKWLLTATPAELRVCNRDGGPQTTVLRPGLAGFEFETARRTRLKYVSETAQSQPSQPQQQPQAQQQQQPLDCNALASALFLRHLQDVDAMQTGVCDRLRAVGRALAATPQQQQQLATPAEAACCNDQAVGQLAELFADDATVSAYELHTSGLLPALLMYLHAEDRGVASVRQSHFLRRLAGRPAELLVGKLVAVLHLVERLPLLLLDSPQPAGAAAAGGAGAAAAGTAGTRQPSSTSGGSSGDQQSLASLVKKLRLQLECCQQQVQPQCAPGLLDLTGRQLRVEPLCTVGELEQYLLKRVCKQWYDMDRATYRMFPTLAAAPSGTGLQFSYAFDFDENGVLYWLGTNAGAQTYWVNPTQVGLVAMATWNGKELPYGKLENFLSRDHGPLNCHTSDDGQAAVLIDLGLDLVPAAYTLRHARGFSRSALRNWQLEASRDAETWTVLSRHVNDEGLRDPGSTCTWEIAPPVEEDVGGGWRYFQIKVTGRNSSNQMHILSCSGLEFYGRVTAAHPEVGAVLRAREQQLLKTRRHIRDHVLSQLVPGARVVRGPDWCWGSQDSLGEGTVTKELSGGKVTVRWDTKQDQTRVYRMQKRDNVYDLALAPSHDEQQVRQYNLTQRKSNSSPALDTASGGSGGGGSGTASAALVAALNEAEEDQDDEERWLSEILGRGGDFGLLKNVEDLMLRSGSGGAGSAGAGHRFEQQLTASDPNLETDAAAAAASAASGQPGSGDFSDFFHNFAAAVRSSMRRQQQQQLQQQQQQQQQQTQHLHHMHHHHHHHLLGGTTQSPALRRQYVRLLNRAANRGVGGSSVGGSAGMSEPPPDATQSFPNLTTTATDSVATAAQQPQSQPTAPPPPPSHSSRRQRRKSGTSSVPSTASAAFSTAAAEVSEAAAAEVLQLCSTHLPDDDFLDDYHEDAAAAVAAAAAAAAAAADVDFPPQEVVGRSAAASSCWAEEELVVKRQCPALLPAFDPIPGRTNVNQTQDFHIGEPSPANADRLLTLLAPTAMSATSQDVAAGSSESRLVLSVKSVQHRDLEVRMTDRGASVFKYVVQAMLEASARSSGVGGGLSSSTGGSRSQAAAAAAATAAVSEQLRRVWDTSFTLAYREPPSAASASAEDGEQRADSASAAVPDVTDVAARLMLSRSAPSDVGRSPGELTPAQIEQSLHRGSLHKSQLLDYIAASASEGFMREWRLHGSRRNVMRKNNCRKLVSAYRQLLKDQSLGQQPPQHQHHLHQHHPPPHHHRRRQRTASLRLASESEPAADTAGVEDALNLLHIFYTSGGVPCDLFHSKKLTQKLIRQAQEPLMLASQALPDWCESVANYCPNLFPFSVRLQLFHCLGFGTTRALMWIQAQKRKAQELHQGQAKRPVREDQLPLGEVDLGRLKRERVRLPRLSGDPLLAWSAQLLGSHACRKAELEIQFDGEQGTGLGPTLEFFSLLAAEFSRRDLGMWICEDPTEAEVAVADADAAAAAAAEDGGGGDGKPAGYYVTRPSGLFPAPYRDCPPRVAALFHLLGVALAKCLQDGRLMDLSLSRPLLRLLCQQQPSGGHSAESGGSPAEERWWSGLLGPADFALLYPERAALLSRLESEPDRVAVSVELSDICLDFAWLPTSRVYSQSAAAVPLREGAPDDGPPEPVTADNVAEYAALTRLFTLDAGLRAQLEAMRRGFDSVFPMHRLRLFTPEELRSLLCGEQVPEWTREDILAHTEPKNGYHRNHPTILMLADVLAAFDAAERKRFLQFSTGCSSLPPGGLKNLHPRLTIVRKHDSSDGSYPSVNTCLHYLKLPEYSCQDVMRDRILVATLEKGFHLN